MISVEIKVPTMNTNIQPAVQKSLWQSSLIVRRDASRNAPFLTGTLRRSIKEIVTPYKAEV